MIETLTATMEEMQSRPFVEIAPGLGDGYRVWELPAGTTVLGLRMGCDGLLEIDVDVPAPDVSGVMGRIFT